jgi:glycosyltransferase involved in cell wall biosynthesis
MIIPNSMEPPMSYWVLVLTKNGEDTIQSTLESIISQTLPPSRICIVDDGSIDNTRLLLSDFKRNHPEIIDIVSLPDRGYDIRRVVRNINVGIETQKRKKIRLEYIMISGDDCFYSPEYAECILSHMNEENRVAIASGDIQGAHKPDITPRGSGRFIRVSFLNKIGGRFPPYYGYEGWIMQKALQLGFSAKNFHSITFNHLRELGEKHKFKDWGLAMKCLGYHPLEVLYRCIKYPLVDRRVSVRYLRVLWDYFIQPLLAKGDSYYSFFEGDLRKFVWEGQKQRMIHKISGFFSFSKAISRDSCTPASHAPKIGKMT